MRAIARCEVIEAWGVRLMGKSFLRLVANPYKRTSGTIRD
jgi:hypothetical protein